MYYKSEMEKANKIIGSVDKKDVDLLALGLKENCLIWSEDKHFRDNGEINLIRTKDFL